MFERLDPIYGAIRIDPAVLRNVPYYHVVVTDHRKRQGGKSLES